MTEAPPPSVQVEGVKPAQLHQEGNRRDKSYELRPAAGIHTEQGFLALMRPAFLPGMYSLAIASPNADAVNWLIGLYSPPNIGMIGLGSALIDSHSMALPYVVAIEALNLQNNTQGMLAALLGGDLGLLNWHS